LGFSDPLGLDVPLVAPQLARSLESPLCGLVFLFFQITHLPRPAPPFSSKFFSIARRAVTLCTVGSKFIRWRLQTFQWARSSACAVFRSFCRASSSTCVFSGRPHLLPGRPLVPSLSCVFFGVPLYFAVVFFWMRFSPPSVVDGSHALFFTGVLFRSSWAFRQFFFLALAVPDGFFFFCAMLDDRAGWQRLCFFVFPHQFLGCTPLSLPCKFLDFLDGDLFPINSSALFLLRGGDGFVFIFGFQGSRRLFFSPFVVTFLL